MTCFGIKASAYLCALTNNLSVYVTCHYNAPGFVFRVQWRPCDSREITSKVCTNNIAGDKHVTCLSWACSPCSNVGSPSLPLLRHCGLNWQGSHLLPPLRRLPSMRSSMRPLKSPDVPYC